METNYGAHGSSYSGPAEGRIVDINNDILIVKNSDDNTYWEVPSMSSVLNDGESVIDDVEDYDELEPSKPIKEGHPWLKMLKIKKGLKGSAKNTWKDILS